MGPKGGKINLHFEVLGEVQQDVLSRMGPVMKHRGFYLAGGTAVALHLGHRYSMDFDWFSEEHIPSPLLLAQSIREEGIPLTVQQVAPGTLHGLAGEVRVSFLEYRYPLLNVPAHCPDGDFFIAGMDDLACMKLSAVAQRGSKKDFVDIYALGIEHKSLPEMIELYQTKYNISDIVHLFYSLVYFDDADTERMPKLFWETDWESIKSTIRHWVKEMAHTLQS